MQSIHIYNTGVDDNNDDDDDGDGDGRIHDNESMYTCTHN